MKRSSPTNPAQRPPDGLHVPSSSGEPTEGGEGNPDRMLALSDAIFAFAITLLVLDLKVPEVAEHAANGVLPTVAAVAHGLLAQWPRLGGYLLSFANIGVMWNNHVTIFRYIKRVDHTLTVLNTLLLLCISLNPFITSLLASYLLQSPAHRAVAMIVYSGVWFVTAVVFNMLWFHASRGRHLLDRRIPESRYADVTARYRLGPVIYLMLFLLALFGLPIPSLICSICLSLVYALPYQASKLSQEVGNLEKASERRWAARIFPRR